MDYKPILTLFYIVIITEQTVSQVDVRLVGPSATQNQGRVEVFYQGTWGTICDDQFDNKDAAVVCRMLGFIEGGNLAAQGAFGPGSGRIWLDDLDCQGSELTLADCMSAGWGVSDCGHDEDVGVTCKDGPQTGPVVPIPTSSSIEIQPSNCNVPDPSVRIRGPSNQQGVGVVEVFVNNQWGSVCDDLWGMSNARVICRMLCYDPVDARSGAPKTAIDYSKSSPIIMDNVACQGNENSIFDCNQQTSGTTNCQPTELATVTCVPLSNSAPDPPVPVLSCSDQYITASFSRTRDPSLEEKHLTIENTNGQPCNLIKSNDTNYVTVQIPVDQCATQISKNESHIMYSNVIKYPYTSIEHNIIRVNSYWVHVSCEFDRNADIDRGMQPLTETVTQSASGQFIIRMMFYKNNSFDNPVTIYPMRLTLGEWLNVAVYLETSDSRLKLVVPNCKATPSTNPDDTINYPLFEDKCSMDADLSFFPLNQTAFGYRYQSFKFVNYSSVVLHCDAFICHVTEKDANCDRSCGSNTNNRRKRSSAQDRPLYHISSVPLLFYSPPEDDTVNVESHVTKGTTVKTSISPSRLDEYQASSTPPDVTFKAPQPQKFEIEVGDELCGPADERRNGTGQEENYWDAGNTIKMSSLLLYIHCTFVFFIFLFQL